VVRRRHPADGFPLAVPIEIRFKDIDSMGHVNNAVYFTYFENARLAYWKALRKNRMRGDVSYVLARAECDFKSQATMEDELVCHIRVSSFGRSSFRFDYLIRDERSRRPIATGHSVQVSYDYGAGKVLPLEEGLKKGIRAFEGRPIGRR
jgi:acyl-CoA thioester hydrolase